MASTNNAPLNPTVNLTRLDDPAGTSNATGKAKQTPAAAYSSDQPHPAVPACDSSPEPTTSSPLEHATRSGRTYLTTTLRKGSSTTIAAKKRKLTPPSSPPADALHGMALDSSFTASDDLALPPVSQLSPEQQFFPDSTGNFFLPTKPPRRLSHIDRAFITPETIEGRHFYGVAIEHLATYFKTDYFHIDATSGLLVAVYPNRRVPTNFKCSAHDPYTASQLQSLCHQGDPTYHAALASARASHSASRASSRAPSPTRQTLAAVNDQLLDHLHRSASYPPTAQPASPAVPPQVSPPVKYAFNQSVSPTARSHNRTLLFQAVTIINHTDRVFPLAPYPKSTLQELFDIFLDSCEAAITHLDQYKLYSRNNPRATDANDDHLYLSAIKRDIHVQNAAHIALCLRKDETLRRAAQLVPPAYPSFDPLQLSDVTLSTPPLLRKLAAIRRHTSAHLARYSAITLCTKCGANDHVIATCPRKVICTKCGKTNHVTDLCTARNPPAKCTVCHKHHRNHCPTNQPTHAPEPSSVPPAQLHSPPLTVTPNTQVTFADFNRLTAKLTASLDAMASSITSQLNARWPPAPSTAAPTAPGNPHTSSQPSPHLPANPLHSTGINHRLQTLARGSPALSTIQGPTHVTTALSNPPQQYVTVCDLSQTLKEISTSKLVDHAMVNVQTYNGQDPTVCYSWLQKIKSLAPEQNTSLYTLLKYYASDAMLDFLNQVSPSINPQQLEENIIQNFSDMKNITTVHRKLQSLRYDPSKPIFAYNTDFHRYAQYIHGSSEVTDKSIFTTYVTSLPDWVQKKFSSTINDRTKLPSSLAELQRRVASYINSSAIDEISVKAVNALDSHSAPPQRAYNTASPKTTQRPPSKLLEPKGSFKVEGTWGYDPDTGPKLWSIKSKFDNYISKQAANGNTYSKRLRQGATSIHGRISSDLQHQRNLQTNEVEVQIPQADKDFLSSLASTDSIPEMEINNMYLSWYHETDPADH